MCVKEKHTFIDSAKGKNVGSNIELEDYVNVDHISEDEVESEEAELEEVVRDKDPESVHDWGLDF